LVTPVKHGLLNKIENDKSDKGNREKQRKTEPIHESAEANIQNCRVFVMHKVLRTSIQVAILNKRSLLGAILVEIADSTVQASKENSQSPIHKELNKWPVSNKQYSTDQTVSNGIKPSHVKVRNVSGGNTKVCRLFTQISVNYKQQECSVEELGVEHTSCNPRKLLSLSWETDPLNKHNNNHSKHIVNTSDNIAKRL